VAIVESESQVVDGDDMINGITLIDTYQKQVGPDSQEPGPAIPLAKR
jgi:hypothetical protein